MRSKTVVYSRVHFIQALVENGAAERDAVETYETEVKAALRSGASVRILPQPDRGPWIRGKTN